MKWYLVAYELNATGKESKHLYERLAEISNGCCPILKSAWLIGHDGTARDIYKELRYVLDDTDYVFITELAHDCYGFLERKRAEWVKMYVDLPTCQ